MTVEALYAQSIKPLTAVERLRLVTLILEDILPQSFVDYGEEWTDEDLADFTMQAWPNVEAQETTA